MVIPLVLAAAIVVQVPTAGFVPRAMDLAGAARMADLRRARELVAAGAAVDATDRRG